MTSKLLAAAAFSIGLLGASFALAQTGGTSEPGMVNPDPGATRSISPSLDDLSSYLSGRNIRPFYADEQMTTLRPEGEVRETFNAMSLDQRTQLRAACAVNSDAKFDGLCRTVSAIQ